MGKKKFRKEVVAGGRGEEIMSSRAKKKEKNTAGESRGATEHFKLTDH